MRRRKRSNYSSRVISALYDLTGIGLVVGAIVTAAVVAYLIYGYKSGGLHNLGELPQIDRHRIIANVALACGIISWSSLIVVVSAIIRYYVEETLGYMLSLGGAVLYFLMPLVLHLLVNPSVRASSIVVGLMVAQSQATGLIMLAPGLALVFRDLISRLIRIVTRPRIASGLVWGREDRKDLSALRRVYGHCWDLPHCRDFIRKICPAYNSGRSCWRGRCGCYCDERTIVRAMEIRGAGQEMVKNAQFSHGLVAGRRTLSNAEKRERCRNCAIYAEHQRQKYRVVSPLVFPVVALAIWLLTPNLQSWVEQVVRFTDRFMKFASFAPQGLIQPSEWTYQVSGTSTVQFLFIAWLSIMAVGYALHLAEYFIFKVQI